MDKIDQALLFAQLDRILMIYDGEDNVEERDREVRRNLEQLRDMVQDYAV